MDKHKSISQGYMTVGEVAKKWMLLYEHYNITIGRVYFPHLP